jgi:hypothetical protein
MVFAVASTYCQSIVRTQFLIAEQSLQMYLSVNRILSVFFPRILMQAIHNSERDAVHKKELSS